MEMSISKTDRSEKNGRRVSFPASMSSQKVRAREIFRRLDLSWPDAHCELIHFNEFQLLIAVVLSAQTTDVSVNRSFGAYITEHRDFGPNELVKMGEQNFAHLIRTIGLAPTKARNAVALSAKLIDNFKGRVPRNREALESLPGVGRKTANVVLNVLFGEPTMAVDTHVARLAVRLGLSEEGSSRERIEEDLLSLVPSKFARNAHHTLIFHGRYLCAARKPQCEACALEALCPKVGVSFSEPIDKVTLGAKRTYRRQPVKGGTARGLR